MTVSDQPVHARAYATEFTPELTARRTQAFALFIIALFFLQDLINVGLARLGLGAAVPIFSAAKEVLVLGFCLAYAITRPERIVIAPSTFAWSAAFGLLLIGYTALGALDYPPDSVLYEGRTLVMPLVLIVFGWMYANAIDGDLARADRLVNGYLFFAAVVAISAIVDYLFVPDSVWAALNIAQIDRLKGYELVSSGALPENMYSFYFGRRAFGLALNPLNLGYVLVPGVIFAWCRRRYLLFAIMAVALVLSWSRLPIVATAFVIAMATVASSFRIAIGVVIVIAFAWFAGDAYRELHNDPSALGHFHTVAVGLQGINDRFFGHGVGAAGIYASLYSELSVESVLLNIWNQIGPIGLFIYLMLILHGIAARGPYSREVRMIGVAYGLTAALSPHLLVIKSTFAFFIFVGVNLGLSRYSSGHR